MREGLHLVEAREASLVALRSQLASAIERGDDFSDDDMEQALISDPK